MHKILQIGRREYVETVKTKTFIIGVFMAPVLIAGIVFFTGYLSKGDGGPRLPLRVEVRTASQELCDEVRVSFERYNREHPNRQLLLTEMKVESGMDAAKSEGKEKLRKGLTNAFIVLDEDVTEGSGKVHIYTYKTKASDMDALGTIESMFCNAVVSERCRVQQIPADTLAKIRNVAIETIDVGQSDSQQQVQDESYMGVKMLVPFFFMYLIFMGMMSSGQQMLSSVIEEKNSRVIEVLLSAVSPFQLMTGKILGLATIGLTVVSVWAGLAYLAVWYTGVSIDIAGAMLLWFPVYYVLGFLLFTSILAGIGSTCNTIKETQSLMMPVMLVFILPLMAWPKLVQSPDGTLARVLSFVPPVTPMVMVLRLSASSGISTLEIIASIIVLALGVMATVWAAAKVFRTGILMYGKRPGLREICRWLRQD